MLGQVFPTLRKNLIVWVWILMSPDACICEVLDWTNCVHSSYMFQNGNPCTSLAMVKKCWSFMCIACKVLKSFWPVQMLIYVQSGHTLKSVFRSISHADGVSYKNALLQYPSLAKKGSWAEHLIQVCQRGGWALFRLFPCLTTKELHVMFTATRSPQSK